LTWILGSLLPVLLVRIAHRRGCSWRRITQALLLRRRHTASGMSAQIRA
jgi:hypothetical protein